MGFFDFITKRNMDQGDRPPAEVTDLFDPDKISKGDALKINAVLSCISIISGAIAALPFDLFRRTENGREKATKHRLYKLTQFPALEMPAFNFMEALIINLLIYGNAYIEIVRVKREIKELHLIPSKAVSTAEKADGEIIYYISREGGKTTFSSRDGVIMHIAGRAWNGREGLSPVDLCMRSLDFSRALENFGASYFGRGARPSGFLKAKRPLTPDAVKNLKRSFIENYAGGKNSGKMIVLEDGMEYEAAIPGSF